MIPLYKVHTPTDIGNILAEVMISGQISAGPNNMKFEGLLAEYLGNPLVTTTGDISISLAMCLYMAGVRPDDEVIMSPLVCLATSCPVRNLFANIRWCDIDPYTGNIDPEDFKKKITKRTKAVMVYHWAGNPADLKEIYSIAHAHNIAVIEDAGEAFGADYEGKKIGNTGADYTVFSFYPNRHITTIDGAAITFTRKDEFEKACVLKRYGINQQTFRSSNGEINPESDIPIAGWNNYMSHIAATLGVVQMKYANKIVSRQQQNGLYFDEALKDIPGITVLNKLVNSCSAYWVYTFLAEDRDYLLERLRQAGIYASKVHLRNDIYSCFTAGGERLKGVDYFSGHYLSIPCGWWVSNEDRKYIVSVLNQ